MSNVACGSSPVSTFSFTCWCSCAMELWNGKLCKPNMPISPCFNLVYIAFVKVLEICRLFSYLSVSALVNLITVIVQSFAFVISSLQQHFSLFSTQGCSSRGRGLGERVPTLPRQLD